MGGMAEGSEEGREGRGVYWAMEHGWVCDTLIQKGHFRAKRVQKNFDLIIKIINNYSQNISMIHVFDLRDFLLEI